MKKLIILLSPLLLFGCSTDELKDFLGEIHDIPAQAAVDEIAKLVKAESLFRSSRTQYEYDTESLEELFIRNEYEILVRNYRFFYCFDSSGRNLEGVPTSSNFLVISFGGPNNDIQANGTPALRRRIKDLQKLSSSEKNIPNFENVLEIEDGKCFEIQTYANTDDISTGETLEEAFYEFETEPEFQISQNPDSLLQMNKLVPIIEEIPDTKRIRLKR